MEIILPAIVGAVLFSTFVTFAPKWAAIPTLALLAIGSAGYVVMEVRAFLKENRRG